MIIKGTPCAGGQRLADHLQRVDTNETVRVHELRGVAAETFPDALLEMEAVGSGSRTKRPFYHASINTQAEDRLSDAQRAHAIDRLEKELGLTDQPRAVVIHEKFGREHCHIVWLRVDIDSMTAIRCDHNFRKHETVARELEREFGHQRVQGAHVERDGQPRPERTPSHAEMLQAERTKITPAAACEHITSLWKLTDNGVAFQAALEQSGWTLARGDRRDFVVVDPKAGVHSLARRIDGATVNDVRARLAGIDMAKLPSVAEARTAQRARDPAYAKASGSRAAKGPPHDRAAAKVPKVKAPSQRQPSAGKPVRTMSRTVRGPRPGRVARPVDGAVKAAAKVLDGVATAFEGLLGGAPSKPKDAAPGAVPSDDKIPLDAGKLPPQDEQDHARQIAESDRSARRQKYLADFSREIPQEGERDAEIERGKKGRERER